MTTLAQLKPVVISLGAEAHHWAKVFATEQVSPERQRQVYVETLAVYSVHSFLRWMEVETDLDKSESIVLVARNKRNVTVTQTLGMKLKETIGKRKSRCC